MGSSNLHLGLALAILCCLGAAQAKPGQTVDRKGKILPLFSYVSFKNAECTGVDTNPSNLKGVCLSSTECSDLSGASAKGNCAAGFGVCCIIQSLACGATLNQNCSYFGSVDFPTLRTTAETCTYRIEPCNNNICQVRLDFTSSAMAAAPTTGLCTAIDRIAVTSPTSQEIPVICGTNTGKHMYIDTGASSTQTTVTVTTVGTTGRAWLVKASQFECDDPNRAPSGCLQYYTGVSNVVSSFNFDGGQNLQSQNFASCVRTEDGMCGIAWANSNDAGGTCCATADATTTGFDLMPAAASAQTGATCTASSVTIPGALTNAAGSTVTVGLDSICGGIFNNLALATNNRVVYSNTKPFTLRFRTALATQLNAGGFALRYTQQGQCIQDG